MPSALGLFTRVTATIMASITFVATPSVVSAHSPTLRPAANRTTSLTIACPVPSDSTFIDSWGDPRSGGRRHQGVDMVASRGTPIAAASAGFAEFTVSNAGGNAIWLTTEDGDKFYYAHLDDWEGESRDVSAGEVVGYVGSSGNAGGDHLHFEAHPAGTPANPYPAVSAACGDTPRSALGATAIAGVLRR